MKKEKKEVIQNHHIYYKEEIPEGLIIPISKREHWEITRLKRYRNLTKNFWIALIHEALKALKDEEPEKKTLP